MTARKPQRFGLDKQLQLCQAESLFPLPQARANKDSLLGSALPHAGGPTVSGQFKGPSRFRVRTTWQHLVFDRKVLRFSQARCLFPQVWTAQTGPSAKECPGNKQEPGVPGFTQKPPVLDKGDVMIHRPCLAAWPAGSDWRTRRPSD